MNKDIESALTKGLVAGYAGGKPESVSRGGFPGKASHIELPDGSIYHDEWFAGNSGGGQELVQVGGELFTRLYAGGTPDEKTLSSLGITDKEVSSYLKEMIVKLGDRTRLIENCNPEPDGDWQYEYVITGTYPETNILTSLESIEYKNNAVHRHAFILCSKVIQVVRKHNTYEVETILN